jgi:hypothetical protein
MPAYHKNATYPRNLFEFEIKNLFGEYQQRISAQHPNHEILI